MGIHLFSGLGRVWCLYPLHVLKKFKKTKKNIKNTKKTLLLKKRRSLLQLFIRLLLLLKHKT